MTTTATMQAPGLDDDTRRLIDAVVRDLMATRTAGGSRDVGSDGGQPDGAAAAGTDQDSQRFFGSILGSIVQNVVPTVVSPILSMLQQRRRELGLPEQRDAATVERDLQSILGALLPKVVAALPGIVDALTGQSAPRSAEEEGERFLPILAGLIPAVVSAVPSIINAFNQQRGVHAPPPPVSDPDVAQRFLGPLLSVAVPQILQAAPAILGSIFGGRRDVPSTAW